MISRRQLVDWPKLTWLAMLKSARNKDELDTKQKNQFISCCKSQRNRGDYESFQNRHASEMDAKDVPDVKAAIRYLNGVMREE